MLAKVVNHIEYVGNKRSLITICRQEKGHAVIQGQQTANLMAANEQLCKYKIIMIHGQSLRHKNRPLWPMWTTNVQF